MMISNQIKPLGLRINNTCQNGHNSEANTDAFIIFKTDQDKSADILSELASYMEESNNTMMILSSGVINAKNQNQGILSNRSKHRRATSNTHLNTNTNANANVMLNTQYESLNHNNNNNDNNNVFIDTMNIPSPLNKVYSENYGTNCIKGKVINGKNTLEERNMTLVDKLNNNTTNHDCIFCKKQLTKYESMHFPQMIIHALYTKYASSQNYYYTKDINEILNNSRSSGVILHKDMNIYYEEGEYLKRFYKISEYQHKISILTEYYKFHKDVSRIFIKPTSMILNKYHDKKRRLEYKKITNLLKSEANMNKGQVNNEPKKNLETKAIIPIQNKILDSLDFTNSIGSSHPIDDIKNNENKNLLGLRDKGITNATKNKMFNSNGNSNGNGNNKENNSGINHNLGLHNFIKNTPKLERKPQGDNIKHGAVIAGSGCGGSNSVDKSNESSISNTLQELNNKLAEIISNSLNTINIDNFNNIDEIDIKLPLMKQINHENLMNTNANNDGKKLLYNCDDSNRQKKHDIAGLKNENIVEYSGGGCGGDGCGSGYIVRCKEYLNLGQQKFGNNAYNKVINTCNNEPKSKNAKAVSAAIKISNVISPSSNKPKILNNNNNMYSNLLAIPENPNSDYHPMKTLNNGPIISKLSKNHCTLAQENIAGVLATSKPNSNNPNNNKGPTTKSLISELKLMNDGNNTKKITNNLVLNNDKKGISISSTEVFKIKSPIKPLKIKNFEEALKYRGDNNTINTQESQKSSKSHRETPRKVSIVALQNVPYNNQNCLIGSSSNRSQKKSEIEDAYLHGPASKLSSPNEKTNTKISSKQQQQHQQQQHQYQQYHQQHQHQQQHQQQQRQHQNANSRSNNPKGIFNKSPKGVSYGHNKSKSMCFNNNTLINNNLKNINCLNTNEIMSQNALNIYDQENMLMFEGNFSQKSPVKSGNNGLSTKKIMNGGGDILKLDKVNGNGSNGGGVNGTNGVDMTGMNNQIEKSQNIMSFFVDNVNDQRIQTDSTTNNSSCLTLNRLIPEKHTPKALDYENFAQTPPKSPNNNNSLNKLMLMNPLASTSKINMEISLVNNSCQKGQVMMMNSNRMNNMVKSQVNRTQKCCNSGCSGGDQNNKKPDCSPVRKVSCIEKSNLNLTPRNNHKEQKIQLNARTTNNKNQFILHNHTKSETALVDQGRFLATFKENYLEGQSPHSKISKLNSPSNYDGLKSPCKNTMIILGSAGRKQRSSLPDCNIKTQESDIIEKSPNSKGFHYGDPKNLIYEPKTPKNESTPLDCRRLNVLQSQISNIPHQDSISPFRNHVCVVNLGSESDRGWISSTANASTSNLTPNLKTSMKSMNTQQKLWINNGGSNERVENTKKLKNNIISSQKNISPMRR